MCRLGKEQFEKEKERRGGRGGLGKCWRCMGFGVTLVGIELTGKFELGIEWDNLRCDDSVVID